ncbi:MAG TPA: wax ester/triacylglycerol synthase family O-acyltransferase [Nevskiaceae bacterium]|nr:wax ester/triacylglycerol synthase family O-acyltransferase [Nevskiaceae bacterium]
MGKSEPLNPDLLAELRDWGGPREMSAFEAVMWRAEVDPRLRSTTTSVLVLDRTPEWERVLEGHRWVTDAAPRFRQRVVEPALGIGTPTWVDDPHFDLDYHLRRVRLPEPGTERQLLDLAQTLAMTPFDKSRSPWEATLVEGVEGGRAAYILKLHHATSDGLGIIQLLTRVLGRDRQPQKRPPLAQRRRRESMPSPAMLAAQQVSDRWLALPQETAGTVASLARSMRSWLSDRDTAAKGLRYLGSARRMLGIKPVAGSGLFKRRSLSWRFDTIEFPLARFKAASKVAEASVNDVFLAGLIGGFRRYHDEMGVTVGQMPIGFPISLRTENDPIGGNKFAGSQYAAPLDIDDPVERIRHIQKFVRDIRAEPALDVLVRLMPVVTRLPLAAITAMTADFTTAQDAQISNIPGIPYPVYLAGAEITHFWPFAPVPGCGMMIVMMSHNGRCCIGVNSDRASVTEPELLIECFRNGIEDVLGLSHAKL